MMYFLTWLPIIAQAAQEAPKSNYILRLLIPMALFFMVIYILLLRPQRKKERQRKEMLSQIKKNDKVMTIGGVYGTVASIRPDEVVLKVDDNANVRVRFSRSSIAKIIVEEEGELPNEQREK